MPRRLTVILVAAAVLIGLSLLVIVMVNRNPKLQNTVLELANRPTTTTISPLVSPTINTNSQVVSSPEEEAIRFVAKNFTEKYGSGSSTSNAQNLVEAKMWGTASFIGGLNRQIDAERQKNLDGVYRRMVTKALVVDILSRQTTRAVVTVSTQREETTGDKTDTYYQDALLNLTKESSGWKIEAAAWKSR